MAWEALVSGGLGAIIALSGTLLADLRRDRRQRVRDRDLDQRRCCADFSVALTEALGSLRASAAETGDAARGAATVAAMAAVYPAREQLLLSSRAEVAVAGEEAFHRLIDVRTAVRSGATLDSVAYHDRYHAYADALWRFRVAVRADLGEPALSPADLDRPDWTDRDRCTVCATRS